MRDEGGCLDGDHAAEITKQCSLGFCVESRCEFIKNHQRGAQNTCSGKGKLLPFSPARCL